MKGQPGQSFKMETVLDISFKSNLRNKSRLDISPGDVEKMTLKCEICDKSFTNQIRLAKHIGAIHERNEAFKCDICDNSYSQKGSMTRHVASVHEGKKPFQCYICDYSFTQKGGMKLHVLSVHEGKKPFKCDICM